MSSMKVLTTLVIPSSFDDGLFSRINEVMDFVRHPKSDSKSLNGALTAKQNCMTYCHAQLHQAYNLGVEQGKLEAIKALKEELGHE